MVNLTSENSPGIALDNGNTYCKVQKGYSLCFYSLLLYYDIIIDTSSEISLANLIIVLDFVG